MRQLFNPGADSKKAALNGHHKTVEYQKEADVEEHLTGRFICYPELGGRLDSLQLPIQNAHQDKEQPAREVLRQLGSAENIRKDTSYNNTLLFPFPNRLHQGCYQFNGQRYAFPVNDAETGNALHGFLFGQPLEQQVAAPDDEDGSRFKALHLSFQSAHSKDYYPFQVQVDIHYFFDAGGRFHVDIIIENTGHDAAPVAAGWHPYFTFGHSIDMLELDLPPMQKVLIDQNMIPTGRKQHFARFSAGKPRLGPESFDTCFSLNQPSGQASGFQSYIYSPVHDLTLTLEHSRNLPYLQLCTPADRQSLALEPVSANINAFQNGEGLCILEPGQRESYHIQLGLHQGRITRQA